MKKYRKLLLVLAAAVLVSGALQLALTAKYASWLPADGIITDIQLHRSYGKGHHSSRYSYEIYYRYTVEGREYSGVNAYSGRDTAHYAGESVTVWYDPAAPDHGSFHPPGPGLWPMVPFIIGVPLAVRSLKQKRGSKHGKAKR